MPSFRNKLDKTHICFFVVSILMFKQMLFMIMATITLTAFMTIAIYTGSETAQAASTNMIKNATAAGTNMTQPLVAANASK